MIACLLVGGWECSVLQSTCGCGVVEKQETATVAIIVSYHDDSA